jgi:DNA helicase-2/ATP-dependent DNA helicase PcrA
MKRYILQDGAQSIESHIDFKSELNAEQYRVVTSADGPCLVLAGAGSGKTRTLVYRLAYLLEKGVPAENILLVTFTNKAAREMQDRAEMLLRYKPRNLWSGTFHHIGNRTLRMFAEEAGHKNDFGILDEHDSIDLLKSCMKDQSPRDKSERFPKPSVVKSIISFAVNTEKRADEVLDEKYPYFYKFADEIKRIKAAYENKKHASNTMDYDDLLVKWKGVLAGSPRVRKYFSDKFRYIMVDEYQDTNRIQADIVDLLSATHRNLLVVGDDAQSIYSFRGARVENILSFPDRFPDTKMFKLETNYRSSPEILHLANDSLLNNEKQFKKELRAINPSLERPALVEVKDLYSQAAFVAQRVLEMREEGAELSDMAVLFRAHYQSAELEMELVKRGIPYIVRGGIRFFEQAHIKDVLSFLKIMVNPADEISWIRALTLCPGIGPGYASRIFEHFRKGGWLVSDFLKADVSMIVPKRSQAGYTRFIRIMTAIDPQTSKMTPGDMIRTVLEEGYESHVLANFDNAKDRIDDIHELVNFSHEYRDLTDFLSDMTLRENFRGETAASGEEEDEVLVLSTIHQAKGLEWDTVMLIGLCEGQFPHPKAMEDNQDMEEERRLFYVSVTRARKYLYMLHPATRFDYNLGSVIARRSRFIEELAPGDYEVWEVSGGRSFFDHDRPDGKSYGSGDDPEIEI